LNTNTNTVRIVSLPHARKVLLACVASLRAADLSADAISRLMREIVAFDEASDGIAQCDAIGDFVTVVQDTCRMAGVDIIEVAAAYVAALDDFASDLYHEAQYIADQSDD